MEDTAQRDRSRRQFRPSILVEKQLPNGKGVGAEEKRGILSEFILCDFHLSRGLQPNVETSYDSPPLWFLFPRSSRSLSLSLSHFVSKRSRSAFKNPRPLESLERARVTGRSYELFHSGSPEKRVRSSNRHVAHAGYTLFYAFVGEWI